MIWVSLRRITDDCDGLSLLPSQTVLVDDRHGESYIATRSDGRGWAVAAAGEDEQKAAKEGKKGGLQPMFLPAELGRMVAARRADLEFEEWVKSNPPGVSRPPHPLLDGLARWSEGEELSKPDGWCDRCRGPLWIATAQMVRVEAGPDELACEACARRMEERRALS